MRNRELNTGRSDQKHKTREDILIAAQQLLVKSGAVFTLEDIAEQTNMSRATVYRYFSNVDLLCAEAALNIENKTSEKLIEEVQNFSLREALLHIQQYFNILTQKNETTFRKYLSVVLDDSTKKDENYILHGARRPYALDIIMKPYRNQVSHEDFQNLKNIITVLSGLEPLVANKDGNGLSNEESNDLLKWALEMILKGIHNTKNQDHRND